MTAYGSCLATGRVGTDTAGFKAMLPFVRGQWPYRVWAVEGATATVDRLPHHDHVWQTSGDSVRLTQALGRSGVNPLA
ncbi:MAG TPA: hypothetical protein VK908_08195 [Jiangellales bacterium]|nr:hypothetical protein [Jiangellales bacterium]